MESDTNAESTDSPAAATPDWAPPFQLLRSRQDRKLGGVAGGLAVAAGMDPTVARLAVVLGCLTGWGVLGYLIAWAVIPEEDPARGRYLVAAPERTAHYVRIGLTVIAILGVLHVIGAVLGFVSAALIGVGMFPAHVFGVTRGRAFDGGEALLGLFLLIGGGLLLFRRHLPWAPGSPGGPGPSGSGPSTSTGTMALATVAPGTGGAGATAGGFGAPPPAATAAGPAGAGFGARASAAARAARTNGPLLLVRAVGWLVGLWFLAGAILGAVLWATGALRVHLPGVPIATGVAALGLLGFMLIRSRRLAAVIAAMALLLVPVGLAGALTRVDGQAGDRSVTPFAVADLEPEYRHAVGALELDLSHLPLPAGSRTPINISMGAGTVEVTVPPDVDVEAKASVGVGTFDLFGNRQSGLNLEGRTHSTGQPGAAVLVISGRAGAGEIVVRRGFTPTEVPVPKPVPSPAPPAFLCTIPEGGGPADCQPGPAGTPAPPGATPGDYRCTVPEGGGPATCRPA